MDIILSIILMKYNTYVYSDIPLGYGATYRSKWMACVTGWLGDQSCTSILLGLCPISNALLCVDKRYEKLNKKPGVHPYLLSMELQSEDSCYGCLTQTIPEALQMGPTYRATVPEIYSAHQCDRTIMILLQ